MIYFEKKDKKGNVIASNFSNSPKSTPAVKRKDFYTDTGVLVFASDDEDLIKSSKVFRKVGEACSTAFDLMYRFFVTQFETHSHTLKKIQGQLGQKIEGIVPSILLKDADHYVDQKDRLLGIIRSKPEAVAEALLYLQKRIFELGAHMASFEIINLREKIDLEFHPHNIRRLMLNIWHAFTDLADESGLSCRFMFGEEEAESNKVSLDYKTINAAIYNFFDNTVKYAMPYSEVSFWFEPKGTDFELIISMKSLRIEKDEIQSIFEPGIRGRHCVNEEGCGIGMYVIKKALELNNLKIEVYPDYSDSTVLNGRQYILNKFIISGKLAANGS